MSSVAAQVEAIHSMLAAGHRSIRLQRHSLMLWGVASGILCLATEHIITPERFPGHLERALALLIFLGLVVSGVAIADYCYTRYRAQERDESIPFVQAQVTKIWWLLVCMGVLFTFASQFFGGGYMVFGIWLVLFGLGVYIHGVFSEQILEWAGVMMILLGIGALALPAPYVAMQWLAASAFGIGMPLLSAMLDRGASKSAWIRAGQSVVWLAVVLVPPALAYPWLKSVQTPLAPRMSLESFMREPVATAIVELPAGTTVPLKVRIGGGIVREADLTLPLTLAQPLDIFVVDGKPSGQFRVDEGAWRRRVRSLWIQNVELGGTLAPDRGPAASVSFVMTVER